jgi:tripartite-type tricarboxylate transporter receptor subunit TctC
MLFTWVRQSFLTILAIVATLIAPVAAQQFPSRPIRIIVAFGVGGTTDSVARLYGQKMSELLKTPIIIENKPGANQLAAIRALQSSSPDGYTLYAATGGSLVQNPALRRDLPYDPLKDFTLIGLAVTNPGVIYVCPDLPVYSVDELVAYSAAHPDELNFGSAGVGSASHLGMEALMNITRMKLNHIPFKSAAEVMRGVIAGNVHVGMMPTLDTVALAKAGKIRPIAVTTSQRLPYLPNVPSLMESNIKGLGALEPHTFISFVGPAGMSPDIVTKLNDTINAVSAAPDVAVQVRDRLYSEPVQTTPAGFRAFLDREIAKWRELGKTVSLPDL